MVKHKRRLVNYRLPEDVIAGVKQAAEKADVSATAWVEQQLRRAAGVADGGEGQQAGIAEGSSRAAPEPEDFSARDGWIEARMKELERSVPSAAARKALAVREWMQGHANGG